MGTLDRNTVRSVHLVGRGDLGVVVNKLFDNVSVTSASSPRQARHVMLEQQQQQQQYNDKQLLI